MSEQIEGVELGDEAIQQAGEIEPPGEVVRMADETVESPVITLDRAAEALLAELGGLIDADYVTGTTRLRDALCARFDLSQIEAEEIVDDLEASDRIRFIDSEEGEGFRIAHREEQLAP
ncbi:MAG: hypothetical protein IT372_03335 [Polyangiaceae bacterium]|nr:hypothetical protein [Polyangiaceae bacterium]